ncbi:hemerythrin domain-containing protein [Oceanobacillus jeddahense]|uniref:hemerythrin domain-containing protein n=1 Tax=Oceanobacillus jeddahense TaxID=1462527 RepID=UPI00059588EE|nr:hemerythrin domain-containing protein [Oceanobacillus jeddahense]
MKKQRHDALKPLSHHHHHALVQAMELKRAGTENTDKSLGESIRGLIDYWEKDAIPHFRDEEEVLLPLYEVYAEQIETELIKEMLYQHIQIRSLVYAIRKNREDPYEKMHRLGELLESNVRFEEREIFPLIEETVPDKYLHQVYGKFHRDSYSGF